MIEIWALWVCLSGIVIIYGLRGLKDTTNIFSPPLILSLLVFGILVKSYFEFDERTLAEYMDEDAYIYTMMYAVLCLLFFGIFYAAGLHSKRRLRHRDLVNKLSLRFLLVYVTLIAIVGFGAQVVFTAKTGGILAYYSEIHGTGGDYKNTSAYLHALPNFLWSALLISFIIWMKRKRESKYIFIILVILVAALFMHTFLFGNRNGIVRFAIILGGTYVFIRRPSFVRVLPLISMLLVGVALIFVIPHLRAGLYLGSEQSLAETADEYFTQKESRGGKRQINIEAGAGHELFFNVAVVQAASKKGVYDYGAQYIFPFINFVPRIFWPAKPTESEFVVDYFALTKSVTGWDAGLGAAPSGIGLSFLAFSWLGSLVWGVLGYYCGQVVRAARDMPSLMNLGFLMSLLIALVYWGAQSFSAFFFAWFFMIMPFYGLRILAKIKWSKRDSYRVATLNNNLSSN